jgi:hypothetical protein
MLAQNSKSMPSSSYEVDLNKQKGGIKAGSHDPIRGSPLVE